MSKIFISLLALICILLCYYYFNKYLLKRWNKKRQYWFNWKWLGVPKKQSIKKDVTIGLIKTQELFIRLISHFSLLTMPMSLFILEGGENANATDFTDFYLVLLPSSYSADPKSTILTCILSPNITFSSFISPWTILCWWRYEMAEQIYCEKI